MAENVYRAAKELGGIRVIMASSIAVNYDPDWKGPGLMRADTVATTAFNPFYGAGKEFIESAGRSFAKYQNLEVVCQIWSCEKK